MTVKEKKNILALISEPHPIGESKKNEKLLSFLTIIEKIIFIVWIIDALIRR